MLLTADNPEEWTTLELRTRRGHRAVVLNVLAAPNVLVGGRTIVAMYEIAPGGSEWALNSWFADGKFYSGERGKAPDALDLLPGW